MTILTKDLLVELKIHLLDVLEQLLFKKLAFSAYSIFELGELFKQSFTSFELNGNSSNLFHVLNVLDIPQLDVLRLERGRFLFLLDLCDELGVKSLS